ncbi:Alpha/Beta hydrolase protein [Xylogone sp. PMI_703]|nr:Alpha/Beta hydrolase protein [Xylogone sp. PMI_703]
MSLLNGLVEAVKSNLNHVGVTSSSQVSPLSQNGTAQLEPEVSPERTVVFETQLGKIKACLEASSLASSLRTSDPAAAVSTSSSSIDVAKCLGIPYAKIPYRWAAPRKIQEAWTGTKDCTRFGPQCPQSKAALFPLNDLPLFGNLGGTGSFPIQSETEDEFDCLNLNIFTPLNAVAPSKSRQEKLPVVIWIHGGAYWTGAGGVDVYDGTEIVARSIILGSPVIVVTINYRLGALGYLHSRELAADAAKQDDVPPVFRSTANLGLVDAYTAVEWVKENISSFGGDPTQITGIGESAGAVTWNYLAVYSQLHVHIPRLVLSSSTLFANQLIRAQDAQKTFDNICIKNGILPVDKESVSLLRQIPVDQLISTSHCARNTFRPIWDGITITCDPRNVLNDPAMWDDDLEEIIFGQCENESWLRYALDQPDMTHSINGRVPPTRNLRERCHELYSEPRGEKYKWYDSITDTKVPNTALSWMALDGHSRYYALTPPLSKNFLESKSTKQVTRTVYKYLFSWTPALWPKDWPASHTADILSIFLNKRLNPRDLVISKAFADELILFAARKQDRILLQRSVIDNPVFNVFNRDGKWEIRKEGTGEFGLDNECLEFWREVADATIEAGPEGWSEISKC